MRTQTTIALTASGLAILAGLGFYIDTIARPVLASGLALVVWAFSWGFTGAVIIILIAWGYVAFQRAMLAREQRLEAAARRRMAERDAGVMVKTAGAGEQVYLIESGGFQTIAKPLHLNPAQYINGKMPIISETEETRWGMYQRVHATAKALGSGPVLVEPPLALPAGETGIIDRLALEQRLLIDGASGSGKSSLLRHLVSAKLKQSYKVILCDPHGSRPKWGQDVDAVGFGERFEEVLDSFARLEWIHKRRIHQVENGHPERHFDLILVVIEELQALTSYFKEYNKSLKPAERVDVGYYIRMFLTRTRKTGIDIIVASQDKGVEATGLKGYSGNRRSFAIVETLGRDGRGHRVRLTDEQGDSVESDAPPLWPDTVPVGIAPQRILQLPPAPTPEQYRIIDALRGEPGVTNYKICKDVFGSQGSGHVAKIEEVRRLFGPF